MSLESGKKSATEMRQAQKDMISKAESVQPTVAVMEPNWNALIASQKAQVKTLGEILEKFDTLTTEERLRAHLEMQLQILRSDGKASVEVMEQYRQTMMQEVKNATSLMQDTVKSPEREVWESHLAGAGTDEKYFEEAVLDFDDPQPDLGGLGTDAAYLVADLSNIVDHKPVEDSTTKHFHPERKKHHGQSMGGM